MKQKRNTTYSYFIMFLFIFLLLTSCQDGFQYQKIKIDSKNKKIQILSDEFVFDSIVIENNDVIFFKAYLLNKKLGTNVLYLDKNIENGYSIIKDDFDEMCYEKNDTGMKNIIIYIRKRNYYGTKKLQDRNNIQKFNSGSFPCDNQTIILDAIGRY